ncbi:MAG: msrA [Rickettsiales bacterium]|jgi:peptide-methionine (S)-S-oxide reductase|nr:msrA [Rickettsiales bacterium]
MRIVQFFALLCSLLFSETLYAMDKTMSEPATHFETTILAGGCFWCTQGAFYDVEGIVKTTSGYIGGTVPNPTYEQVSSGNTGHYEAVEVVFDPERISYDQVLTIFWKSIDPTDANGQFADRGTQYHTAIFYKNTHQQKAAEASREALAKQLNKPIMTKILAASPFYPAEKEHQDYQTKNPTRYKLYYYGSGRPQRLKELYGDK